MLGMNRYRHLLGVSFLLFAFAVVLMPDTVMAQNQQGGKRKRYEPDRVSTFLTLNAEILSFQPSGSPLFDKDNIAFGLKIGTVGRTGWYMNLMSNFNFKGAFKQISSENINYNVHRTSYLEVEFGVVARHFKPVSFHFGGGLFYYPYNYQKYSGEWGHLYSDIHIGPIITTGFMFHMGGFVLSAEVLARINVMPTNYKPLLDFGLKVGIGFCVGGKNKKEELQKSSRVDLLPKSQFVPQLSAPSEYRNDKPEAEAPDLILLEDLDSLWVNLPVVVEIPVTQEPALPPATPLPETPSQVKKDKQSELFGTEEDTTGVKPKMQNPEIMSLSVSDKLEDTKVTSVMNDTKKEPAEMKTTDSLVARETPVEVNASASEQPEKEEVEKPCGILIVKDTEGNQYQTLQIGNQCWMKQNLRVMKYANGDIISLGDRSDPSVALRYYPEGNASYVADFGYLYNWKAVMHGESNPQGENQGICPDGWHVPSIVEWRRMLQYLASQSSYQCGGEVENVAKSLSTSTAWVSSDEECSIGRNVAQNNATGFSAMPAGAFIKKIGLFGKGACFWSSTPEISGTIYGIYLLWDEAVVTESAQESPSSGFSVRCVKNTSK